MAVPNPISFTPFDPLTADELNDMRANEDALAAGTALDDASISPENLVAGTGTTWAWQTWTPTWTASSSNPSLGNGTITARYAQIGKFVVFTIYLLAGSTTTFGSGGHRFSYPVAPVSPTLSLMKFGNWVGTRQGTGNFVGGIFTASGQTGYFQLGAINVGATYATYADVTQSVPGTWANTDEWRITGYYEAA